jgi:mono/diheme cytochrome c family protein
MTGIRFGVCSLGIVVLAAALGAQTPAAPPAGGAQPGRGAAPAPQNLQVLPKDTPAADVRAMMMGFAQGLGVQCSYCHVAEGRGGRNDFAADDKAPKKVARVMMRMVMNNNEMIAAAVGKPAADVVKVQCATCHRGAAIPKVEMPPPVAAPAPGGAAR